MKLRACALTLVLASIPTFSHAGSSDETSAAYQLHAGDTIQISVWREDKLNGDVLVLPDGSVSFPLVGRLDVGGSTTSQVEQQVTERLKHYIPDPVVTVIVKGIGGNRIFVLGKVATPGAMQLGGPTTLLQVLSQAGGLNRFADEGGIKIIRHTGNTSEVLAVHYPDLVSGKDMSTNFLLRSGDTVVVP